VLLLRQRFKLAKGTKDKEHAMSQKFDSTIAVVGVDIGKSSFHVVGQDDRGAIVLRQRWNGRCELVVEDSVTNLLTGK
jgi:hypothetical protein